MREKETCEEVAVEKKEIEEENNKNIDEKINRKIGEAKTVNDECTKDRL